MKIYSASILVLYSDTSGFHYPLLSGINRYSSCQDYLDRAAIPYITKSPTFTPSTTKVLINIMEAEISQNGSITQTGGLDHTLYF